MFGGSRGQGLSRISQVHPAPAQGLSSLPEAPIVFSWGPGG